MFDNVALNVVIGMVFIYLLYSLLVTILSEIISNWLGMRATVLRRSLERMLNDTSKKPETPEITEDNPTTEKPEDAQETGDIPDTNELKMRFADRFYDAPSIKYIARDRSKVFLRPLSFRTRKPSYISKDNFSQTLVHLFRNNGDGVTEEERINTSLEKNTLKIEPQTLYHIKNLYEDAKGNVQEFIKNLERWFEDTMDRANGWYKRKIRVISLLLGFTVAVFFNLDTIQMAKLLAVDSEAREQLVQLGIAAANDSSFYRRSYKDTVDSAERRDFLDSAYTRIKSDVDKANLVLGLGWDFSSLSRDFTLTDSTLNQYFVSCLIEPLNQFNQNLDSMELAALCDEENASQITAEIDAIKMRRNKIIKIVNDSLDAEFISIAKIELFPRTEALSQNITAVADNDSIPAENPTPVFYKAIKIYGKSEGSLINKAVFVLYHGFCPATLSFWGILITALLLSLGAPFWFDLLNKIVSIRGTGVKPEEKKHEENIT